MLAHYYGNYVRRFFIIGALLMNATLPFFFRYIPQPLVLSIIGILIISVAAGLTSPRYASSKILNVLVAIGATAVFEWYAVKTYTGRDFNAIFFLVNQVLAVIFLIALYYSVKTLRSTQIEPAEKI